jgi:hypothetical protein
MTPFALLRGVLMNGKTPFPILVILLLSAISVPGQGQTDQSSESATLATTTSESTLGPTTTTTTTTPMTLFDGYSFFVPSGIAHIIITKQSNADLNEYI